MDSTEQATSFDRYLMRRLPRFLHDSQPAPEGVEEAEWRVIQTAAKATFRANLVIEFADRLAAGFRPSELATGEMDVGREMIAGRPVTHLSTTPLAIRQEAQAVRNELSKLPPNRVLDPLLLMALEEVAQGRGSGSDQRQGDVVKQARDAVAAYRAAVAAQKAEETAKPLLVVRQAFVGPAGRHWQPGEYRVDPVQVSELERWRAMREAQAQAQGLSQPEEFVTWPPFELPAV
jgi:hypothetical protein